MIEYYLFWGLFFLMLFFVAWIMRAHEDEEEKQQKQQQIIPIKIAYKKDDNKDNEKIYNYPKEREKKQKSKEQLEKEYREFQEYEDKLRAIADLNETERIKQLRSSMDADKLRIMKLYPTLTEKDIMRVNKALERSVLRKQIKKERYENL